MVVVAGPELARDLLIAAPFAATFVIGFFTRRWWIAACPYALLGLWIALLASEKPDASAELDREGVIVVFGLFFGGIVATLLAVAVLVGVASGLWWKDRVRQ